MWRDGVALELLAAVPEDPGSVTRTHMVAHNHLTPHNSRRSDTLIYLHGQYRNRGIRV